MNSMLQKHIGAMQLRVEQDLREHLKRMEAAFQQQRQQQRQQQQLEQQHDHTQQVLQQELDALSRAP